MTKELTLARIAAGLEQKGCHNCQFYGSRDENCHNPVFHQSAESPDFCWGGAFYIFWEPRATNGNTER